MRSLRKFFLYGKYKNFTQPIAIVASKLLRLNRDPQKIECIVIADRSTLIVLNPKVGSRYIIHFLKRNNISFKIRTYDTEKIFELQLKFMRSYAFLRNPEDRVLSCYKQKFENQDDLIRYWLLKNFPESLAVKSFDDFLQYLNSEKGGDDIADSHWRSQLYNIFPNGDQTKNRYTKLYKLENITECLVEICQLGKKTNLVYPSKKNTTGSSHMTQHLNERLKSMILQRYQDDFAFWKSLD